MEFCLKPRWLTKQVSLRTLDTEVTDELLDFLILHVLSDGLNAQIECEPRDAADNGSVRSAPVKVVDQGPINLEDIDPQ